MIALSALAVFAVLVAPPVGPDEGCPSARQVADAMQARFPSMVAPAEPPQSATRADVLRSFLDVAADGTVVRFSLVDARGETQLRRTLPAPGRGRPVTDCVALAETLAAIVERYLGIISYDLPDVGGLDGPVPPSAIAPKPPASPTQPTAAMPRAALVLVGLGWRMPTGGRNATGELEGRIGAEVELNRAPPRVAVLLSVGLSPTATSDNLTVGQSASLTRFPVRLGASLKLPAGPGWLEPAVTAGIDLLAVSSMAGPSSPPARSFRLSPGLETAVGYRLKIAGHFHIRPRAAIGVAFKRYEVSLEDDVVFGTSRAYASFGIDTGVLFQ